MKKDIIKFVAVLLTTGAMWVGPATRVQADIMAWGDPSLGHSWDQLWVITSGTHFNTLTANIISPAGANFQSAALLGFTPNTWIITQDDPTVAKATGPATGSLEFTTHFMGNPFVDYSVGNSLWLQLIISGGDFGLNDQTVFDMKWDGANWSPAGNDVGQPNVPDGGMTILLLGLSMLGMTAFFRRRLA